MQRNHPQKPPAFESQKKRIEQQQQRVLKSNMATICQSAREQRENPHGNNNDNTLRTLGKNCTWNFYLPWQRRARNLGEGDLGGRQVARRIYI